MYLIVKNKLGILLKFEKMIAAEKIILELYQ